MTPRSSVSASSTGPSGLVSPLETSCTGHRAYRGENRVRRLQRAVPEAVRCVEQDGQFGGVRTRTAFVTLTYRPGVDWSPRHISQLQNRYRSWLQSRGQKIRSVWVLELTKAGVPHYHLILVLPRGLTPPKPDKQGWWPHGLTRVEWARNATGYLAKYASKAEKDFAFPRGARLYGARGCGRFLPRYRHHMRPRWLRRLVVEGQSIRRAPGGRFVDLETGETWRSPYMLVARCSRWTWVEFAERSTEAMTVRVVPWERPA